MRTTEHEWVRAIDQDGRRVLWCVDCESPAWACPPGPYTIREGV